MSAEKQNIFSGVTIVIEHQAEDKNNYNNSLPSVARRLTAKNEEYAEMAQRLKVMLAEQFSQSEILHRVMINPGPGSNWEKDSSTSSWWHHKVYPRKGLQYPRVGSFEVLLRLPSEWFPQSSCRAPCSCLPPRCMAWSKLQCSLWPDVEDLGESIVKLVMAVHENTGMGWHDFLCSQTGASRSQTPLLRDAGISPIPITNRDLHTPREVERPMLFGLERPMSADIAPRPNSTQSGRMRPKPYVPERPATAEPQSHVAEPAGNRSSTPSGYHEPWVEAKWKAKQVKLEKEASEEAKGNVTKTVQVDVFGGVSAPVKPVDPKQKARVYKHLKEALARRKSLETAVVASHPNERSASVPPGWSDGWVKEKWKAKRERVEIEVGPDDLPGPRYCDLLGARYDHPPWIRLLQQPDWKVKLEQKTASSAGQAKPMTSRHAREPPPLPVSLEERPPGPVIKRVIRDERSEGAYLATVIGRTAAKKVMVARKQKSGGVREMPPPFSF